jgi:ribosome-associated translation inhibitor RaiA
MRIEIVGENTISQQARTYAEYQVFAALTQFSEAGKVQRVRVLLRPVKRRSGRETIACTVTVALEGSASFRIRTTGAHAYAAINRAVERIRTNETAPGVVDRVPSRLLAQPSLGASSRRLVSSRSSAGSRDL